MSDKTSKEKIHNILLVDDAEEIRLLITHQLRKAGYTRVIEAASAADAFSLLGLDRYDKTTVAGIDLIIMDIVMPEIDGIEACRRIKEDKRFEDIPVIMITALADKEILQSAFDAGAMDYITKPVDKLELIARVRSSLRLKDEMENRRERERELIVMSRELAAANQILQRLSLLDGLTGIPNRRRFDEVLAYEWKQAMRSKRPLSLVMMDIDHFKDFNDHYGHLTGDDCLKKVAMAMSGILKRPTDFLGRYGGEEFAAILPMTASDGAMAIATAMRIGVLNLAIPHDYSSVASRVTISMGIATLVPRRGMMSTMLISAADQALYEAKAGGRNRIAVNRLSSS
ncbi:MAG: diguanylate cyclase [Syntrophus sp. (in: bacteria)]